MKQSEETGLEKVNQVTETVLLHYVKLISHEINFHRLYSRELRRS
jgi:hypothetical protein